MKVLLTKFGKRFALNEDIPVNTPLELIKQAEGCDCGQDNSDPYPRPHSQGCSSLYITVQLPDGRHVLEKKIAFKVVDGVFLSVNYFNLLVFCRKAERIIL